MKNDYIFGSVLAGTAIVNEKEDHLEMQDVTGVFHDEIRQVNNNIVIGKYYSDQFCIPLASRWIKLSTCRSVDQVFIFHIY